MLLCSVLDKVHNRCRIVEVEIGQVGGKIVPCRAANGILAVAIVLYHVGELIECIGVGPIPCKWLEQRISDHTFVDQRLG
jgi:hypothetical protein